MRSLGDRDPPPKKNIHKNTKPLDPVIVGEAWDSCPRPSVSKPQPQLYAECHWRIPEALPRGLRSCFCSLEGKIEQWCFHSHFVGWDNQHIKQQRDSSSHAVHTWAHPMEPSGSTCFVYAPAAHVLLAVPISASRYSFFVKQKPKQMSGSPWCGQM